MKVIGALLVFIEVGLAASITNPQTNFRFNTAADISATGTVSTSLQNVDYRNAISSGTVCWDGFCPGQSAAGVGPTYTANEPLSLRLVGFSMTSCTDSNGCSIPMVATGIANAFSIGEMHWASITIHGTGSPNFFLGSIGPLVSSAPSAVLGGDGYAFADATGVLVVSYNLGPVTIHNGRAQWAGEPWIIVQLGFNPVIYPGQTIDSLDVSFAFGPEVPEPSSLLLVGGGLAIITFLCGHLKAFRPVAFNGRSRSAPGR